MSKELWVYNGLELSSKGKWDVEEVLEGIGVPKHRGSDIQIPFHNGNKWIKKRFDSRKMVLSMWIKGDNKEDLDDNIDSFLQAIGKSGLHTLRRIMRNGEIREAQAELPGGVNFAIKSPGYARFALEFEMADPFFYGLDPVTESISITSSSQTETISNTGTAPTTKAVITMNGPMDSPKITNLENDIWLQYQGSINSGESVIINTNDFTCTKGGENYIAALAHGGDPRWLILEAGYNQLEIEAGATGGNLEIQFYPAYF